MSAYLACDVSLQQVYGIKLVANFSLQVYYKLYFVRLRKTYNRKLAARLQLELAASVISV